MSQCPKCKEQGPMIEKTHTTVGVGGNKMTEFFCNVCGHSWKILET